MALSEGFGFEERWLRAVVREVPKREDIFQSGQLGNAQYVLGGLGNCQVKALRDWSRAMSLVEIGSQSKACLTRLGSLLAEYDPSLEEDGTWWIIHAKLSFSTDDIWFYSYYVNDFQATKFTRSDLRSGMLAFRSDSASYIEKKCLFPLLHTMSATRLGNAFGVLRQLDRDVFERSEPEDVRLAASVVGFVILDWMNARARTTVGVEELMMPGRPGRWLGLSRRRMDRYLDVIQDAYNKAVLWVSRTAGLNSVATAPEVPPLALLRAYFIELLEGADPVTALELGVELERSGGSRDCLTSPPA